MRKMLFDPARQKLTLVEKAGHRQERRAVAKPDLGIVSARAEPRDVTASTTEALSIRFQNRNEALLETVERWMRGFVPGNGGRRPVADCRLVGVKPSRPKRRARRARDGERSFHIAQGAQFLEKIRVMSTASDTGALAVARRCSRTPARKSRDAVSSCRRS